MKNYIIKYTMLAITLFAFGHSLAMQQALNKEQLNEQLVAASSVGDIVKIKELLANDADINAVVIYQTNHHTPLSAAASNNRVDAVNVLLAKKADVNLLVDKVGNTALSLASGYGHDAVVAKLIGAGADVNAGSVNTPLKTAVDFHNMKCIKALVAAGANPLLKIDDKPTALDLVLHSGTTDELKEMLTVITPSDLNQVDSIKVFGPLLSVKMSPLFNAVISKKIKATVLLLAAGANPSLKKTAFIDGKPAIITPLEYARLQKQKEMVVILENFQVSPEEINYINTGILSLKQAAPQTFVEDVSIEVIKPLLIQNVIEEKMKKIKVALPANVWGEIDKDALHKALELNIRRALSGTPIIKEES